MPELVNSIDDDGSVGTVSLPFNTGRSMVSCPDRGSSSEKPTKIASRDGTDDAAALAGVLASNDNMSVPNVTFSVKLDIPMLDRAIDFENELMEEGVSIEAHGTKPMQYGAVQD